MNKKLHLKKNDKVIILTGKDRGKIGKILDVNPEKSRVLVEGVNMITKHRKPKSQTVPGGIDKKEGFIHSSNAMIVCGKCDKPTRIAKKILSNGEKVRQCKKCQEVMDVIKKGNQ